MLGQESSSSRIYVSLLTVCKQLPNFLLIPFSGALADARDRRHSMMILDICGAVAPVLYLLAAYMESIYLLFLAVLIQSCIASIYEPCRAAIVPMMVDDDESMKRATTLMCVAWSFCLAIGSGKKNFAIASAP